MKYRRFINAFITASQINPDYAPIPLRKVYFPFVPPTKGLFQVDSFFEWPVTLYIFRSKSRYHLVQIPSCKTTPLRLSVTAYSIHSSLLENVPATADWGDSMSWWHGPTYHCYQQPNGIVVLSTTKYSGFLAVKKQYYIFLNVCL